MFKSRRFSSFAAKATLLCAFVLSLQASAADLAIPLQTGTDALQRQLEPNEQMGPLRPDRFVGVFYFLFNGIGADATMNPLDATQITNNISARTDPYDRAWPNWKSGASTELWRRVFWGKPLFGYYKSIDRWVIRKHIQLLTNAGVDFLVFDMTNVEAKLTECMDAAEAVMAEILAVQAQKIQGVDRTPPKVVFYTNTDSRGAMELIYNRFYSGSTYANAWFRWPNPTGKPLIIGRDSLATPALRNAFTIRESQWPQGYDGNPNRNKAWPWIEFVRPQPVRQADGVNEIVNVSLAQHAEDCKMSTFPFYNIDKNWGRGFSYGFKDHSVDAINRGANVEEQWAVALAKDPPVTFVTSWNEWGAGHLLGDSLTEFWTSEFTDGVVKHIPDFDYQTGGFVGGSIFGGNPAIVSPTLPYSGHPRIFISNLRNSVVVVRLRNRTNATLGEIYFRTNKSGAFDQVHRRSFPIVANSDYWVYTIPMSNVPAWTDSLVQIRIDPAFSETGGNINGSFSIDYVKIQDSDQSTTAALVWDFNTGISKTSGWSTVNQIANYGLQVDGPTGTYGIGGNITGVDPYIFSPDAIGTDITNNKFVTFQIDFRSSSPATTVTAQLYFTTTKYTWLESRSKTVQINNNAKGVYTFDMSGVGDWNGVLKQLRFDPAIGLTSGSFSLDYIRILPTATSTLPAKSWEFNREHYMIDDCNQEYSRDIEMMAGGYGDNYYMQLIDFVRKYKGIGNKILASAAKTIAIDANFSQWDNVTPEFVDFSGDVMERTQTECGGIPNHPRFGQNDIRRAKVARDKDNLYFYVQTEAAITQYAGSNWMRLFIDVDGDHTNGWNGYDYIVNRQIPAGSIATVERSCGGWNWARVGDINFNCTDTRMHFAIPRQFLGNLSDPLNIQFKWVDNALDNDIMNFYVNGDAAPDGRLNYNYITQSLAQGLASPRKAATSTASFYPAENAIEGAGVNNYWKSIKLTEKEEAWLQLDMGGVYPIKSIKLTPRYVGRSAIGFPRDFHFKYSVDGKTWYLMPGTAYTNYPLPGGLMEPTFSFPKPVSASYIRWCGTKHRYDEFGKDFYMQLNEINAYLPLEKNWEFTSTTEGWVAGNKVSNFAWQSGGIIWGLITGTDPQIYSADNLNIQIGPNSTNDVIKIRLKKNNAIATRGKFYFITNARTGWDEVKQNSFPISAYNNEYTEYTINMSGVTGWEGTLKRLRFDPEEGSVNTLFYIDYIRVESSMAPAKAWEFDSYQLQTESWSVFNNITNFTWKISGIVEGTVSGVDPWIVSADNLNIDITNSKTIKIKLKNMSSATQGLFLFTTNSGVSTYKEFVIKANENVFTEYTIDMSQANGWGGTLKQLFFDPTWNATSGSFAIDYIRVCR
jgi:hypothetical protein